MGVIDAFIPVGLVMLGVGALAGVGMGVRVLVGKLDWLVARRVMRAQRVAR